MVIEVSSVKSKSKSGLDILSLSSLFVKSDQELDISGVMVSYTPASLGSVTKTGTT